MIENRVVTVGLLDSSQVHPREVYADSLTDRVASIIVTKRGYLSLKQAGYL